MRPTEFDDDTRAVSETSGMAILIGMTIIVTAVVGLNVMVADQDTGPPDANFSYDHYESNSVLLITHAEGDEFPAGELLVSGPDNEVTWAGLANVNETRSIGPGDLVQLSRRNAYGSRIKSGDTVRIYHATGDNRTQLGRWPKKEGD